MSRDGVTRRVTKHDDAGKQTGADVFVRFDSTAYVSLNADGSCEVGLDFEAWREIASAVHRECAAAAFEQPIEVTQARVREALSNAVKRAAEPGRNPASRRAAAAALHRIADMVLAGTVTAFDVSWPIGGDESQIRATYQVKMPSVPERIVLKLGEGVIAVERVEGGR